MKASLIPTQKLSQFERDGMYSLLSTHFKGVKREVFEDDLNEKNWVILLQDKDSDAMRGFSTLLIYETEFEGEILSVLYSGDTIVDPSAWSSSVLSRSWISAVKKLRKEYPQGRLYWLLICGGYRTYRFLPIFWKEFYPRVDVCTPSRTKALIRFLSCDRFGKYYDETAGVVRFPHPQILRDSLRGIPPERLNDPHISFFEEQNQGHLQGDELVCLTEICEENLTPAGKRMWFASQMNNEKFQQQPAFH